MPTGGIGFHARMHAYDYAAKGAANRTYGLRVGNIAALIIKQAV